MTVDPHLHPELETYIEELAQKVIGPRRTELAGGGRKEDEGLIHKVDTLSVEVGAMFTTQQQILEKLNNGGIKVKLPWQIWVAIIGALGGLGVQLIATLSMTPLP